MRSLTAACAALLTIPALIGATPAEAADCTIRGTAGDDRLVGTTHRDVICGLGGDDVLVGAGGHDLLLGGGGSDVLKGGAGDDVLKGGTGIDTVSYAGTSARVTADLDGRADDGTRRENDQIVTTENLVGGSGGDVLAGNGGDNTLVGGAGSDDLTGAGGSDELAGARGDDEIAGGSGPDQLSGGPQDDLLVGGGGVDDISGGTGVNYCDTTAGEESTSTCRYDWTGPEVTSLTTNASAYGPGDRFVITMHVADPSGVASAGATFTTSGVQNDFCGQFMQLVEGSERKGVWELSCTIPLKVRNGTYEARPYARDGALNWTNTNGGTANPIRATFEISGGSSDSRGPSIESVTVAPGEVAPGDALAVDVAVSDAAGVGRVGVVFTVGGVQNDFCGQWTTRISGTPENGVWRLSCTVPASARTGVYTLKPYAVDELGNYTNTNGGTRDDTVGTLSVAGGSTDSEGPSIELLSTSASSYRPGDLMVVRARLTDPSGVTRAGVMFLANGVQKDFCGQQMTLVDGSPENGYWELRCIVPSTATVGEYEVYPIATDAVNNHTNTNGGGLSDLRAYFEILP